MAYFDWAHNFNKDQKKKKKEIEIFQSYISFGS
jgi:hypothetical protein